MAAELVKVIERELSFQDIAAKRGVDIVVRPDGLIVWINVDGICRARIITNGITVPINVEDGRAK